MDNQQNSQKRVYETTRSFPATKEHGNHIRSRIVEWKKNPVGKPPTLKKLAEELNLSRERVRQICVQEGIDRPHARKGRDRIRTESTCNSCGNILPFRKSHYVSVTRCQICNPTHIPVECNNCGKEFTLIKSVLDARLRKDRGYKGKLYCTRECFFEFQTKAKWWQTSPIQQISAEQKISVKEANKIFTGDLNYDTGRRITSVKDR